MEDDSTKPHIEQDLEGSRIETIEQLSHHEYIYVEPPGTTEKPEKPFFAHNEYVYVNEKDPDKDGAMASAIGTGDDEPFILEDHMIGEGPGRHRLSVADHQGPIEAKEHGQTFSPTVVDRIDK